jgi:hypothetical protein
MENVSIFCFMLGVKIEPSASLLLLSLTPPPQPPCHPYIPLSSILFSAAVQTKDSVLEGALDFK